MLSLTSSRTVLKWMAFLSILTGAMPLLAASTDVNVVAPAKINYQAYQNFAWWPLPPLRGLMRNEDARDEIQSAIIDILSDKDIDESFLSLKPDFYIAYYAQVKGEIIGTKSSKSLAKDQVIYPGGYTGPVYQQTSADKNATYFVIDFIRPDKKSLFWRGSALFTFDKKKDREEQLEAIVKKILATYPGPGSQ